MKYFFTALIFLFVVVTPVDVQAALLTCSEGDTCNFCELTRTLDNIIDWVVTVAILIATIGLAYAGFRMSSSRGDVSTFTAAKEMLWNIVVGLFIIMAAWMIVDTIIKTLAGGDLGVWNEVENCGGMFAVGTTRESVSLTSEAIEVTEVTSNPYGQGGVYALEGPEATATMSPSATADGQFDYDAGIAAQRAHASPALSRMLNCMAQIVPGNVGRISSISDNRIVSGSETFATCVEGGCAHAPRSRHYGGTSCTGQSYAVDLGDEQNVAVLCRAANSCGAVNSCSVHNGNHVHLDLPLSC